MHETMVEILLVEDNPNDVTLTLRAFKRYNLSNGVRVVSTLSTRRAMSPNSVDMPVATAIAWPRPLVTSVPA